MIATYHSLDQDERYLQYTRSGILVEHVKIMMNMHGKYPSNYSALLISSTILLLFIACLPLLPFFVPPSFLH